MVSTLHKLDQNLLLSINNNYHPFLDRIMSLFNYNNFIYCSFLILLLFTLKRSKVNTLKGLFILFLTLFSVIITDQLTSSCLKPYFKRLRPTQEPSLQSSIHTVSNYKGGQYGFPSSHAANSFCFYHMLKSLLQTNFYFRFLSLIWAIIVSYSRIYLGVHYPSDVFIGGLLGIVISFSIHQFCIRFGYK